MSRGGVLTWKFSPERALPVNKNDPRGDDVFGGPVGVVFIPQGRQCGFGVTGQGSMAIFSVWFKVWGRSMAFFLSY